MIIIIKITIMKRQCNKWDHDFRVHHHVEQHEHQQDDHLAMVVEQEYPLGADGDHHRVLQRVVDHLGHLSDRCDDCFCCQLL